MVENESNIKSEQDKEKKEKFTSPSPKMPLSPLEPPSPKMPPSPLEPPSPKMPPSPLEPPSPKIPPSSLESKMSSDKPKQRLPLILYCNTLQSNYLILDPLDSDRILSGSTEEKEIHQKFDVNATISIVITNKYSSSPLSDRAFFLLPGIGSVKLNYLKFEGGKITREDQQLSIDGILLYFDLIGTNWKMPSFTVGGDLYIIPHGDDTQFKSEEYIKMQNQFVHIAFKEISLDMINANLDVGTIKKSGKSVLFKVGYKEIRGREGFQPDLECIAKTQILFNEIRKNMDLMSVYPYYKSIQQLKQDASQKSTKELRSGKILVIEKEKMYLSNTTIPETIEILKKVEIMRKGRLIPFETELDAIGSNLKQFLTELMD